MFPARGRRKSDASSDLDSAPKPPELKIDPQGKLPTPRSGASIVANAASLMVSRVAVAIMGWFGTLLIVRHLSVSDWGRFSFVFGLLGLMAVVTNMANPRIVMRQLANDDGRLAGTYILLRLALGLLGYAIAMSFVVLGDYPPVVVRATALAALSLVIANTSTGYDVLYQFRMELSKVALALAFGQAAQLVLTIVLALMHSSLVVFTIPAVLCEVVVYIWKWYRRPRQPVLHYGFMWNHWKELIKLSIPLALGGALTIMYYSLDTVMLSKMQTFRDVGIYGISYKFAGIVAVFATSMSPALFPILVRHWPEEADRFRAVMRRTVRLFTVVGALVALEFTIFAAKAIGLLYGHHYTVGANAARVVVVSECVGFFISLSVTALIAMNRNVVYPIAAAIGLVFNFGVNLFVIPRWSYMGAAWATLATELVVTVCLWMPMSREAGGRLFDIGDVVRVLLSMAVASAAAIGIWAVGPWPVAAAVGAGVYVVALIVTRIGGPGGLKALVTMDDKPAAT